MMQLAKDSKRKYLLYIAVGNNESCAELFGEDRLFDVAVNEYTERTFKNEAEWYFNIKGMKFEAAAKILPLITTEYQYYAFLDNDLKISTKELNNLFTLGAGLGFDLFQPALTPNSHYSWSFLLKNPNSIARKAPFVEVMAPFFSNAALKKCKLSFSENISGWGLDTFVWPKILDYKGMAIIDAIPVFHTRPIQSLHQIMSNGLTPSQEWHKLREQYESSLDDYCSVLIDAGFTIKEIRHITHFNRFKVFFKKLFRKIE